MLQRAVIACVAAFCAASALAQPVVPVTYQGVLEEAGAPFDGPADLMFSLYEDQTGGVPVAGPIEVLGVDVAGGLFVATFDLDTSGLAARTYWLEVGVGPAEQGVEILGTRQPFNPAALSVQSAGAEIEPDGANVLARGEATLDVAQNTTGDSATSAPGFWQSFVPSEGGVLREIRVFGQLLAGSLVDVRVYRGRGTGGPLLLDEQAIFDSDGFLANPTAQVEIEQGLEYTFEFVGTAFGGGAADLEFEISEGDAYPEGACSAGGDLDARFRVGVLTQGPPRVYIDANERMHAEDGLEVTNLLLVNPIDGQPSLDPVRVPDGSIESDERSDEPGIARGYLPRGEEGSNIARRISLIAPAAGFVHVIGTGTFTESSLGSGTKIASLRRDSINNPFDANISLSFSRSEVVSTGDTVAIDIRVPFTVQHVYTVSKGERLDVLLTGQIQIEEPVLTGVFYPTDYGVSSLP